MCILHGDPSTKLIDIIDNISPVKEDRLNINVNHECLWK